MTSTTFEVLINNDETCKVVLNLKRVFYGYCLPVHTCIIVFLKNRVGVNTFYNYHETMSQATGRVFVTN